LIAVKNAGDKHLHFLPANTLDYLAVTPGQVLAFISTSTSSGYVGISEMT
jgi:hypothetical protein